MGKKARERRKLVKKLIRMTPHRWTEDEFGNKKQKITKAEARRRFLRRDEVILEIEIQLVERLANQARDELIAIEDARVFNLLTRIAFDGGRGMSVIQGGKSGRQIEADR